MLNIKKVSISIMLILAFTLSACNMSNHSNEGKNPEETNTTNTNVTTVTPKAPEKNSSTDSTIDKHDINDNHPIIFSFKDQNGAFSTAEVLGGWKDGKWINIMDLPIKLNEMLIKPETQPFELSQTNNFAETDLVKGGEKYKFYSHTKLIDTQIGSKPSLMINGYTLDKLLSITFNPIKAEDNLLIGINGTWDALPRAINKVDGENTYSCDLDNDGKDEFLKIQENTVEVKGDNDETSTVLEVQISVDKNGQNVSLKELQIDGTYVSDYEVLIMDINGDGLMEIIVAENGHNTSISAFKLENSAADMVLSYYNGD